MHLPYHGHRAQSMIAHFFIVSLSTLSACATADEASLRASDTSECLRDSTSDEVLLRSCVTSPQVFVSDEADVSILHDGQQRTPALTVNPPTGLRDRAVVTVRGHGFEVNMRTNARLCRAGTMSPDDCLPAGRPPITADDGVFYQEVIVYAGFGNMRGDWVDCTAPRSCELIVFRGRDGRTPVRAPLTFASGESAPRPMLRIATSGPLSDQGSVYVHGTGFDRGTNLSLQQHLLHEDERGSWHEILSNVFVTADARGEFEQTITVFVGPTAGELDCLEARCVLAASELQGRYGAAQASLRFVSGATRGTDYRADQL